MKRIRSFTALTRRQRRRYKARRTLDVIAGTNPVQLQVTTVKHTDLAKISVLVATAPYPTRKDTRMFRALERWLQGNGIHSKESDFVFLDPPHPRGFGGWWLRVTVAVLMVSASRVGRELERIALEEYYG